MAFVLLIAGTLLAWTLDFRHFSEGLESRVRWGLFLFSGAWALVRFNRVRVSRSVATGIFAFATLSLVAAALSNDLRASMLEFTRFLGCLFLLVVASSQRGLAPLAASTIGWTCTSVAALSLLVGADLSSYTNDPYVRSQTAGVTTHPNILALAAAIGWTYWIFAAWGSIRKRIVLRGVLELGMCAIALYAVLASGSRSGVIALLLATFCVPASVWISRNAISPGTVALGVGALCIISIPALTVLLGLDFNMGSEFERSNAERISAWRESLLIFYNEPINGQGFGLGVLAYTTDRTASLLYAHNVLLTYLANCGVLGVLMVAILCMGLSGITCRAVSAVRSPGEAAVHNGELFYFGLAAVLIVFATVESALQSVSLSSLVFAVALGSLASGQAGERA